MINDNPYRHLPQTLHLPCKEKKSEKDGMDGKALCQNSLAKMRTESKWA